MTTNPTYASVVTGTAGNDILFGGTGNDLLTGGAGSDIFVVSNGFGSDTVSDFATGAGGDVLRVQNYGFATFASFKAAAKQIGADTVITLSSTEIVTLQNVALASLISTNVVLDNPLATSGAINNSPSPVQAGGTLTTGATNDFLQAAGTGVTLAGGAGDDTYQVYDHNTKIVEQTGQGIDTVLSWSGYSLVNAPNVENLTLTGSVDSAATGNDLNNIIVGNAGNNVIDGGKGNDVLTGGAGSDTFVIHAGYGNDIITDFQTGAGGDILQLNGTNFKTLTDVTAAMTQVGTDVVLALASGQTTTFENTTIKSFTATNVNIVSPVVGLVQTFNDDFNTLSAGQDPSLTWRTSYAWGGAASYKLAGEQGIYVDNSFSGLPGSQAASPLGLNPFSIQNGQLVITAQPIPANDAAYVGGAQFSSGMISSENSFVQTYGYFEMTATLPNTTGAWPAFWLLPINQHGSTELDVLEAFGQNADQAHWDIHSTSGSAANQGAWANTTNLTVGEHTFAVDWTPYTLTFFVDGAEVAQEATPSDMNTAMYMIANLAMGGSWPGNAAPGSTATMSIDSITAYQLPEYTLANYTLLASGAPTNTIAGTANADTLTGTSGNDLLGGAGGADIMSGGAGDDTYIVTDSNAKVIESYGGGVDTVDSSVTYTLPDYVENLTLTGSAAINATGNSESNIIIGNAASNIITGGPGNDIMTGGGGGDTFVINHGDGSDVITDFHPGSAGVHDIVQLNGFAFTSFNDIQAAMSQVGSDVYLALTSQDTLVFRNATISAFTSDDFQLPTTLPVSGAPTIWVSATANDQTIYGSAANEQIAAFGSGNTLIGGAGDDTYVVGDPSTKIIENVGGGVDTVQAWSSFTLPANVENLTLMQGGLTGVGNQLANRIVGSSGNDILNGGGGNDWLYGGAGNDTFVYAKGSGHVTIADLHVFTASGSEHDTLALQGYDPSAYLTNINDEWTVHYSGGTDTLHIVGVTHMTMSDYSFVSVLNVPMNMTALTAPTISVLPGTDVTGQGITNAGHFTLVGKAEAGLTIEVFDGATEIGTATVDNSGSWSFVAGALADGNHAFTAVAADGGGNLSAVSAVLSVKTIAPKLIEAFGSTSLVEVGTNFFLDSNSSGSGPELKYGGAPVVAGQFGTWMPIGAEQTATGYEIAWKVAGVDKYSVWTTDSSGNYMRSTAVLSGTSATFESYETSFHQDLNGDGVVGVPTTATVIEASGSTSLVEVGVNFFLDSNSSGSGPELKYGGAPVVAGQFGTWMPIGAEQTATGYEIAWKVAGVDKYSVWTTDNSGHYLGSTIALSGTSATLVSLETSFYQDLNGDGVIGTPTTVIEVTGNTLLALSHMTQAATIDTGATLELTGADSGSIRFNGTTGTLVLDHSSLFAGTLINLTGNGNPSSSDQIDLRDIAFSAGTKYSYAGNSSGGTLTISDAQGHAANLSLAGNYTNSTFTLSSDGHGGTIAIDPPKDGFNFASSPAPGSGPTVPMVTIGGAANDAFVFHQTAGGNSRSPDSFVLDWLSLKAESGSQIAPVNVQSDHQWMDAVHDTGSGHPGSISAMNAHFAALHAGDFIIH